MINIDNLPKVIERCGDNKLFALNMHITAWNKLCVCYKETFKEDGPFVNPHIFSQVVEPDMEGEIRYSDFSDRIIDVPTFEAAVNTLSARLNKALSNETFKVKYK